MEAGGSGVQEQPQVAVSLVYLRLCLCLTEQPKDSHGSGEAEAGGNQVQSSTEQDRGNRFQSGWAGSEHVSLSV